MPASSAESTELQNCGRRDTDNREIDGVGYIEDRAVSANAGYRITVSVHRVGGPDELARQNVAEELAADGAPARRRVRRRRPSAPRRTAPAMRRLRCGRVPRRVRRSRVLPRWEMPSPPRLRRRFSRPRSPRPRRRRSSARCPPSPPPTKRSIHELRRGAASCSTSASRSPALIGVGHGEGDLGARQDREAERSSARATIRSPPSPSLTRSAPRSIQSDPARTVRRADRRPGADHGIADTGCGGKARRRTGRAARSASSRHAAEACFRREG